MLIAREDFRIRRARVCTSAPAFTLSCPRSHFPRTAFRGPRRVIGIPQQQLSTMGYPRKSYPHRCPQPCAKRSRPRVCARVYIIYRSPVGRSRGVSAPLRKRVRAVVPPCPAPPSAGWGRAKAKADAPSRSAEPLPACVPNHCAQRRKCTRPTPPLPVRSPRVSPPTAAPPPVDGRTAVRRVGEGEGKGGRPLAQCRAPARLCAESLCAKAEVHKANPAPARALSPRQPAYGRAPAR